MNPMARSQKAIKRQLILDAAAFLWLLALVGGRVAAVGAAMNGVRVIPVPPLGHAPSCRICATVDAWAANRKRRSTPQRAGDSDLAGGFWGAVESRDTGRRSSEAPNDTPRSASPSRRGVQSATG